MSAHVDVPLPLSSDLFPVVLVLESAGAFEPEVVADPERPVLDPDEVFVLLAVPVLLLVVPPLP